MSRKTLKHKKSKAQRRHIIRGTLLAQPGRGEEELERGIAALGMPYERQAYIRGFYVDFLIKPYKIVVEVDGPEHSRSDVRRRDENRQAVIESAGYRVVRVDSTYAQMSPINAAQTALYCLSEFEAGQYVNHRTADFSVIMEAVTV